jgi:hypothetical protein
MKISVSWDIKPCSAFNVARRLLAIRFRQASCWAYSSTVKMEATCSSEMLVDLTTRCFIPEDNILHNHH